MTAAAGPQPIVELAVFARLDFGCAIDYTWKAPPLIDALAGIEEKKLAEYPDPPRARQLRRVEQLKLNRLFPALVSQGCLFIMCSLFEGFVFQLAAEAQKFVKTRIDQTPGKGVMRWVTYLRRAGVDTWGISPWPQVDAALKIRNCLTHAQGTVRLSKDSAELHRIVRSRTFLEPRHRQQPLQNPVVEVEITKSLLGERLEITSRYAWLAGSYLRDYFSNLCRATATCMKAYNQPT
jgi:hypothetical protein